MTVPYSSPETPALGDLTNVQLNNNTLANNDVVKYDASTKLWVNGVGGGGGGGASISGIDNDAVFKSGTNGDTFTGGITRNPATAGKAVNLDTSNFRVGIGGSGNALSMVNTLEVQGNTRLTGTTHEIKIDDNELGIISGAGNLKLYSANDTSAEASVEVDGSNKKLIVGGTMETLEPTLFDTANSSDLDGVYKIKLRRGMDLWGGAAPFTRQNTFNAVATQFPTGQTVEYQNKRPIQYPAILSRSATGIPIAPATTYVISLYGTFSSFSDNCFYDPLGMRASLNPTNGWTTAGAPSLFRSGDVKCLMRVKWNFKGRWSAPSANNRAEIYVNQYRSGVLLRNFQVAISNNDDTCIINGERTFIGFNSSFGEDFDCGRDWYEIEVANMTGAGHEITADYAHTEVQFILAQ